MSVLAAQRLATQPVDCEYDGDCALGCHEECVSWTANPAMPCQAYVVTYVLRPDAVDDEWRGCVAGRCTAFRQ
ncbi:MAG: hypothetical protein FWD17_12150 [Polyangiaceae bacterium]|nr:hypothetical protein [Polyangiaceae bacterium]